MGPRELEIILLSDNHTKLGSAGEIISLETVKARQLIDNRDAVLNTVDNQDMYGYLYNLEIGSDTSKVSVTDKRLKTFLSELSTNASKMNAIKLKFNHVKTKNENDILITKDHFIRALSKIGVEITNPECLVSLQVRDEVLTDFNFTIKFLKRFNSLTDWMRLEVKIGETTVLIP